MSGDLSPAARAAVLKALLDEVKKAYEQVRGAADDSIRGLHELAGVTKLEIRIPGVSTPVAHLTLSLDEAHVAVDQPARLEWCRQRYPTEVESVTEERVRPAFVKVLEGRLKVDEDGTVLDPETGEVIDWARPVPAGPPTSVLTFTKTGRAAVADAHRAGILDLPALLALPAQETGS